MAMLWRWVVTLLLALLPQSGARVSGLARQRPVGIAVARLRRAHPHASAHALAVDAADDDADDADDGEVSDADMEAAIAAAIAAAGVVESLDAEYYDEPDEARVHVALDSPDAGLSEDDVAELRGRCVRLLEAAGREGWALNVRLTGDEEVRQLNRAHRGKDAPTDILSYCALDPPLDGAAALGDLAISLPYVRRSIRADAQLGAEARAADEARGGAYGRLVRETTLASRLPLLIVHGICHLLGHDHEGEAEHAAMLAAEEELLAALDGVGPEAAPAR